MPQERLPGEAGRVSGQGGTPTPSVTRGTWPGQPVDPAECPGDGSEGELFTLGSLPLSKTGHERKGVSVSSQILQRGLKPFLEPRRLYLCC